MATALRSGPRLSARARWGLWVALLGLLGGLLALLVWLAALYENNRAQSQLEQDANDAAVDLRMGLSRKLQDLQSLQTQTRSPESWNQEATALLRTHREWLRLEWREPHLGTQDAVDSPYRAAPFERMSRAQSQAYVTQACATARRLSVPAYSPSYFLPLQDGLGMEVMELCLPLVSGGRLEGYFVATYALTELLTQLPSPQLGRSLQVSLTEADGTRLAMHGGQQRGRRTYSAQHLLDLPGATFVLRLDSWRATPALFPNVLTALVAALAMAVVTVLALLARDTRRRLRAEHELSQALAFRNAMEDSLVTGLRARDLEGRTTYVNPAFCEMVGFSADELLGTGSPAPYWPEERAALYLERQQLRLAGGQAPPREGYESVFMRKDGTRFPVLVFEARLIDQEGRHTGWMSAVLDISEQRRVEELSRASQERLQATARLATVGEMASLLSHELNQPLAAIASYASGSLNMAAEGLAVPDDVQLALRRIAEQAERAGRVIKGVQDFVRRGERSRQPLAPQALIDDIMPLVQLQARKQAVVVDVHLEADLPRVVCDRTMVEQVLLNLCRNAMQAMDQAQSRPARLQLSARRVAPVDRTSEAEHWIEFSVADQGPGIPESVREQLFTPFFTTKAEGMGLGLSLCRTVVEQHGGFLGFEPNTPTGTIFRFTLPVNDPVRTA